MWSYTTATIVYVLAIMGILFKSTKTDSNGHTIYSTHNLPQLTNTGRIVIILITLSFAVSLFATWQKVRSDNEQTEAAVTARRDLEQQLNDVKQKNDELRSITLAIAAQGKSLSDAQAKSFTSVLNEQAKTGEGISNKINASANVLNASIGRSIDLLNISASGIAALRNPIDRFNLEIVIDIPLNSPLLESYHKQLDSEAKAALSGTPLPNSSFSVPLRLPGQILHEIAIPRGSPFYPRDSSNLLNRVLGGFSMAVLFYKTPNNVEQRGISRGVVEPPASFQEQMNFTQGSDIYLTVEAAILGSPDDFTKGLSYNTQTQKLTMRIDVPAQPLRLERRITGVSDLLSSQMIVSTRWNQNSERDTVPIARKIEIRYVHLAFNDMSLDFVVRGQHWTDSSITEELEHHVDATGFPFYVYTFPATFEQLRRFLKF
jgi:hypothetical protein